MATRGHNVLDGMEELFLSLVRKHSSPDQWGSWLKIILHAAAMEGDEEAVLALLKAGAYCSSARVKHDQTPLHAASQGGSLAVVVSLLKTSAICDVNKKTHADGETPLHFAVKCGHTDIALALVRAGGDVNLTDIHGRTALISAASSGRAELVNDLLLSGSRVDATENSGDTALCIAARLGNLGMVKALLQARACRSIRGKDYMSPIDLAVERGDTDTLLALLASGPKLDKVDDNGGSALYIAVGQGRAEVIDMLLDAGANPNSDPDGKTTYMHMACSYLHTGIVEVLLRRTAMENLRDGDDELPYDVVGHAFSEGERDTDIVESIRKMLTRAPADRAWRRRGWLTMLKARKRGTDKEPRRTDHGDEDEDNQDDDAEAQSVLSSRRKLADEGKWVADDAVHVHPSRKRFHWIVTKVVDVADELIFRTIVSYL